MFLRNLFYLGCNSLSNQHWNWCLYCLFSLLLKKKMLLILSLVQVLSAIALKQRFNEYSSTAIINVKSQTDRYQKSNLFKNNNKTLCPLSVNGFQLSQDYKVSTRAQFILHHLVPRSFWYSFN